MPTYEYRCRDCDETFEQHGRIAEHEDTQPNCPACGSAEVEQLFSAFYARTSRKS